MKKLVLLLLLTATAAIGLSPNVATAQVDRGSENSVHPPARRNFLLHGG